MSNPPSAIFLCMDFKALSTEVRGIEALKTPSILLSFIRGTATYIIFCWSVLLNLVELPIFPLIAVFTSFLSLWLSMLRGSSSESPITLPEGSTTVIRVSEIPPISLQARSIDFSFSGERCLMIWLSSNFALVSRTSAVCVKKKLRMASEAYQLMAVRNMRIISKYEGYNWLINRFFFFILFPWIYIRHHGLFRYICRRAQVFFAIRQSGHQHCDQ